MVDGTRLKTLDDNVKAMQDSHSQLRQDVETISSSLDDQKILLQEVLGRLSSLAAHKEVVVDQRDNSSASINFQDGSSILGRHKPTPVQLARFSGFNPERWVPQADRYFDFYGIKEIDRLTISSFYLDDSAADWYDWMHRNRQLVGWNSFTDALIKRFCVRELEEPEGLLAKLHQITTVSEYRGRFEAVSNRTMYLPPLFLVHCFVSRLRADIKHVVLIHKPLTLEDAMSLAHLREQRIALEKGLVRPSLGNSKPLLPTPKMATTDSVLQPPRSLPLNSSNQKLGFQRLTPAETTQKRAQGLCYRCDEKYTWDHKCKNTPQLLLFDDEPDPPPPPNDSSIGSPESDARVAETLQMEEVQAKSAISYNALAGGCSISTLRFTGYVHGKPVQVLLDGGSTHNFVQTRMAQFLNLNIETAPSFSVLVGNGEKLPCAGVVKQVPLVIQDHKILVDFYVLPLQGWDMVLGISWLATLGSVITNYATSQFEFTLNGQRIFWQGDTTPVTHPIHFNALRRLHQTHAISEFYRLELISQVEDTSRPCRPEMTTLLDEFIDVFQQPHGLPPNRPQDHGISLLPNSVSVNVRPYRYPHFQKQEIERLVSDMLQQGIIRPSGSSFSSPVLLVRKKDGTWRFCVDYRALNAIIIQDRFPLPSIDELFDELHGAKFFSKLDLLAGYHQIHIKAGDEEKTTFRTHDGHYEFLVMPFGLTNAPSTFQRLMNDVFRPYLRKFVLVFFDDILVYSPTWEDHLQHVGLVLQVLRTHQLVAKLSKCVFGQSMVGYLGHIISNDGVAIDPDKIVAIQQWPVPQNVKEVRRFLGLAGYYRRFIHHYASIAGPLTDLLKKDAFYWSSTAVKAFEELKGLLSSTPVLRLPDFTKPFNVETDASGIGIGAILSQDNHPIAFFSQKLCPRMQKASAYQREMFAVTQAIAKWRQYLLGRKFTVITDQQSLKNLKDQVIQTPEQQKWLSKLVGYDFDILYRSGKHNIAADALSRVPSSQLFACSRLEVALVDEI
ncbi:hypothetical protein GQ457_16G010960 [Hibiscus cannabinus]